jgi:LacI family transcriptional regulator
MRTTIRDVARGAGVSVATVSRVLNESGPVREETRRRVLAVAQRLRYTPNGAARSLSTRKTMMIGVLLPNLFGEFFSEVIRGADQAAQQAGYHLLVSGSHAGHAEIEGALRAMLGRVDGLVVMSPDLERSPLPLHLPDDLPLVLLSCRAEDRTFDSLVIDNYAGAYAVTRHLIEVGHRRIALIRGGWANHDARERARGYRQALEDGGVSWSPELEVEGDFTEPSGHRAMELLLGLSPRATAVFACNDSMAIGALGALRESGVAVPSEVAVVGFDDILIARYLDPPLTTVRVPISRLGTRAVELLLAAIGSDRPRVGVQEVLPTELVVRASCGFGAEIGLSDRV